MALKSLVSDKKSDIKKNVSKNTAVAVKKTSAPKKTTVKPAIVKAVIKAEPVAKKTSVPKKITVKPAIVKAVINAEPVAKKTTANSPDAKQAKPVIIRKLISNAVNNGKLNPIYNRADMFYKNTLKALIEKRYRLGNAEDDSIIEKGIDLSIKHNDRSKSIIEKSREQDWNELYIEMFRNFPASKGWVYTSEAEFLAYFFPGRVLWTKLEPIKTFCESIYNKAIDSGIFKDLRYQYPQNSGRLSKAIKINAKTYSLNFYQIYTEVNGEQYYNVGIIMPFVLLMDFHIDYKIFKQ